MAYASALRGSNASPCFPDSYRPPDIATLHPAPPGYWEPRDGDRAAEGLHSMGSSTKCPGFRANSPERPAPNVPQPGACLGPGLEGALPRRRGQSRAKGTQVWGKQPLCLALQCLPLWLPCEWAGAGKSRGDTWGGGWGGQHGVYWVWFTVRRSSHRARALAGQIGGGFPCHLLTSSSLVPHWEVAACWGALSWAPVWCLAGSWGILSTHPSLLSPRVTPQHLHGGTLFAGCLGAVSTSQGVQCFLWSVGICEPLCEQEGG